MQKELTAIVCSGGGMRSAHGAGFLYAMATKLGITSPDIMTGSSGDAGNVLYFSSGQYKEMKHVWTELLSTPKFISPLRFWKMMDINYFIDDILKKQEPLDIDALRESPIRWSIPISEFDTGCLRYVSASDSLDPFEILRAATAVPITFGKKILLTGKRYIDGEIGSLLQDHISHVTQQGAKRILVLNHTQQWNNISRAIFRGYAGQIPQGMHDAVLKDISKSIFQMDSSGASVVIVAPQNLNVGCMTRDRKKLQATFEQGVEDALSNEKDLRALFQE